MLLQLHLPKKAADSPIMAECRNTALAFSKMQGLKSLTLNFRIWQRACYLPFSL